MTLAAAVAGVSGPLMSAPIATTVLNRPREISNRPVTGATKLTRLTQAPRSQPSAPCRASSTGLMLGFREEDPEQRPEQRPERRPERRPMAPRALLSDPPPSGVPPSALRVR